MQDTSTADETVGGRYRLLGLIGVGGMGRVWRANDELLQREVAVKEIIVPSTQPMREARAAARLAHPGVVQVFDVVRQHDRSWIVMEYVKSRSLHEAVQADGPLPPREVARIGAQILAALRAAHAAGVLHRDVKPHNVLLSADGRALLGDFGLATIAEGDGAPAAIGQRDGGPDPRLGSPQFIAPERLRAADAGAPADLFSLGATLYAAVEGRPPFVRADTDASLRALLHDPPDPPSRAGPLAGIILDLLAKDPVSRPDASEVESRLRVVAEGERTPRIPAPRPPSDGPWRGRAAVPPPPPRHRVPRRYVVAALTAALLVAGSAAAVAEGRDRSRPTRPATAATSEAPGDVPAGPFRLCGSGAGAQQVVAAVTRVPAGLPRGWIWFRDPTGFSLAMPAGWQRSANGNEVCFGDPAGRHAFTVNMVAVVTRQPLAYWQSREEAELTAGTLPDYRRISMGVLLFKRGAADWEYTYQPDSDTTLHERRVLAAVTDRRSYLLRWTTADHDWPGARTEQRQQLNLFASAS